MADEWENAWRRSAWGAMPYVPAQAGYALDFLVMWTDIGQLMRKHGLLEVVTTFRSRGDQTVMKARF